MTEILSLQRLPFAEPDVAMASTNSEDCSAASLINCGGDVPEI